MTLTLVNVVGHQIWLTRKDGHSRVYRVTRQFFNEHVYATASLASMSWFDAETSAGFVQSVSDDGVEHFGTKRIDVGSDDYYGVGAYEKAILDRRGVTSLSFELTGDGGAAGQFSFLILEDGEQGRGRSEAGSGPGAKPLDSGTLLGFDSSTKVLREIHEIYGERAFIAERKKAWAKLHKNRSPSLIVVPMADDFRYDEAHVYEIDESHEVFTKMPETKGSR